MGMTRCRAGDGDCSYPDPAVAMVDGALSAVRARLIERLLSVPDLEGDEELFEVPVELLAMNGVASYEDLVNLVLEGQRAEGSDSEGFGITGHARQRLASVEEALADASSDDWVIVYCSPCGHMWRKRVRR